MNPTRQTLGSDPDSTPPRLEGIGPKAPCFAKGRLVPLRAGSGGSAQGPWRQHEDSEQLQTKAWRKETKCPFGGCSTLRVWAILLMA